MGNNEKKEKFKEVASLAIDCKPKNFWLWVASPPYYLEPDGSDRKDIDPGYGRISWTCSEDTNEGDLIVLYRTAPKTDVKYLVQATSDAYIGKEGGKFSGWHHCNCHFLYKFENSVLSKEMKENAFLKDSEPVRRNYQGNKGCFKFSYYEWNELQSILKNKNPVYADFLDILISKRPSLEKAFPNEL